MNVSEHSGISQQGVSGPLGGFLERFRGTGGVPAAVGGDLASELAPVLAELDKIEQEAESLRARAGAERAVRAERLEGELARIAADARTRGERARDEAFANVRRNAEAEAAAAIAAGARAASSIEEAGAARLPAFVAQIVAAVAGGDR